MERPNDKLQEVQPTRKEDPQIKEGGQTTVWVITCGYPTMVIWGWPMMSHAYNINQLKSFKLLKYLSKSKSNQKKVPLKSKISKHSTNSSKPLVKSTSLLWKHLLFIRPHAFFGAKNTCGRFCLQNQGRCSLELSWKATAKVRNKHIGCFAKWLFFPFLAWVKVPNISNNQKKRVFPRFFFDKICQFFCSTSKMSKEEENSHGQTMIFQIFKVHLLEVLAQFFWDTFFHIHECWGFPTGWPMNFKVKTSGSQKGVREWLLISVPRWL